jgi:hypothetical protein
MKALSKGIAWWTLSAIVLTSPLWAQSAGAPEHSSGRTTGKQAQQLPWPYCQDSPGFPRYPQYPGTGTNRPCNLPGPGDSSVPNRSPYSTDRCSLDPLSPSAAASSPRCHHCRASAAGTTKVLCDGRDVAKAIFDQYGTGRPIGVFRVNNVSMQTPKGTYLLLLAGTEFDIGRVNNLITDVLSSPGLINEYANDIRHAVNKHIPIGATIIIAGHSLGGMEAQNLIGFLGEDRPVRVITFGSPKTVMDTLPPDDYARFASAYDLVPRLALAGWISPPSYETVRNPGEGAFQPLGRASELP